MLKVAINGFGRIGRNAFKIISERFSREIEVVAVNDLTNSSTLAHLLRFDTAYGAWDKDIKSGEGFLSVDGRAVKVFSQKDPERLPWRAFSIDVVIESTGLFRKRSLAKKHLDAGAKAVVISAPSKSDDPVPTVVVGVNKIAKQDKIINNASCTTNSIAPMMAVLDEAFGVEKSLMTSTHGFTASQNLQDGPHKDLRRARAAGYNIVPTSTGAAEATTQVLPRLQNKFDGVAIRVPIIVGSISDITALLEKEVSVQDINHAFISASQQPRWRGVLAVTSQPLVSSDIIGRKESVIVDLGLTRSLGNLVKVFGWYDNEWGYSNRLVEQVVGLGKII